MSGKREREKKFFDFHKGEGGGNGNKHTRFTTSLFRNAPAGREKKEKKSISP